MRPGGELVYPEQLRRLLDARSPRQPSDPPRDSPPMSELEKRLVPFVVTTAAIAYVMSWVMDKTAFSQHWMIREDGLLENWTAGALLTASLICAARVKSLWQHRGRTFLLCTAAASAVFFFGFGEEISWGQRLFGIASPEFFVAHNGQSETNLHNMIVADVSINKLIFGKLLTVLAVAYLIPLPVFFRRSQTARRWVNRHALPIPRPHHVWLALAMTAAIETGTRSKMGEILEFTLTSLVVMILLNPLNLPVFRMRKAENDKPQEQEQPQILRFPTAVSAQPAAARRAA